MKGLRFLILLWCCTTALLPVPTWANSSPCDPEKLEKVTRELGHILENPWRRLWDWRRALQLFSDLRSGIQGLKEQKRIDALTQIYNRQAYNQDLPDLIREQLRYRQNFALIVVDLDHFKSVNDTFGHLAGDAALHHVAQTLRSQLRAGDRVYRYGGEEFVIVMKNASFEGIEKYTQRVVARLAHTSLETGPDQKWKVRSDREGPLRVSFSAGAILIDTSVVVGTSALQAYLKDEGWHPPTDPDPLFLRADEQLYHVKHRLTRGMLHMNEYAFPYNVGRTLRLFQHPL